MPNYYRARHILLEDEEDALEILDYLKNGQQFEDLAKEYSECDTSLKGGHLGRFPTGTMLPEFEKALYHMEIGEISSPIKTKFGFHIIERLKD